MDEVVKKRYNPAQWNIYAAQALDGDNWAEVTLRFAMKSWRKNYYLLFVITAISKLPVVHIRHCGERSASAIYFRQLCDAAHPMHQDDIYPVFRELFHKQSSTAKY
ncbi:DUF444 family protein [Escherichia coli]